MGVASAPGVRVERALLCPHDKTGLVELARGLESLGVELWATAGTRSHLGDHGVAVRAAEELTGIGSWFGGRVKTLHPGILGGILAPRTPEGRAELQQRGLRPFDLVAVNFYPFEEHRREAPTATDREEFVDIGGVTLARAAAKNHDGVVVLTDPTEYDPVLEELRRDSGTVSAATRRRLALAAFRRVAEYDAEIAGHLFVPDDEADPFPSTVLLTREPYRLRYGENPHQKAAVYTGRDGFVARPFDLVKGESLSYTNLLDIDTALETVAEFPLPAAAVVKHATPCGVAEGATLREAIERAIATDPVARFGCAVAVNRPLEASDPDALHGVFVDLLAAPDFGAGARASLDRRPKIKLVRTRPPELGRPRWEARSVFGRVLVQESDQRELAPGELRPVTSHRATPEQLCALDFAWRVVRHAKSNAIVLAQGPATVGIGSGQPTRVKAVELACDVAGPRARGSVLASDAFFPFADGVEVAGRAGVAAIVQPGGSLRDPEVIAAAERAGVAMYLTGWRVFRH